VVHRAGSSTIPRPISSFRGHQGSVHLRRRGWALAPTGFGGFSRDLLLGNFGDGRIGAYDPTTGGFIDFLRDGTGNPIVIDGLWGLTFGPSADSTALFFTAGPDGEAHGLLGTLTPK